MKICSTLFLCKYSRKILLHKFSSHTVSLIDLFLQKEIASFQMSSYYVLGPDLCDIECTLHTIKLLRLCDKPTLDRPTKRRNKKSSDICQISEKSL